MQVRFFVSLSDLTQTYGPSGPNKQRYVVDASCRLCVHTDVILLSGFEEHLNVKVGEYRDSLHYASMLPCSRKHFQFKGQLRVTWSWSLSQKVNKKTQSELGQAMGL